MRKMLNKTYKKWKQMWILWKLHLLDFPLEEFVTYNKYMTKGHVKYFQILKTDINIRRHLFVLKEYLLEAVYPNLENSSQIYER